MKVHMRDNASMNVHGMRVPYSVCEYIIAKGKATVTNWKDVTCLRCLKCKPKTRDNGLVIKKCSICKELLPMDKTHFSNDVSRKSGFSNDCKICSQFRGLKRTIKTKHLETERQYRKRNAEMIRKKQARWASKNQIKVRAHQAVRRAINRGELKVLDCEVCGAIAHAHHEDYEKPLEVIWLCARHHKERHANE